MDNRQFIDVFESVRKIIGKLSREYYIKLWTQDDWEQEARIVLYQLLERFPDLVEDEEKLRGYFKTRFRSYVMDNIRRQESKKRAFDKMVYEEISELGHRIPDQKMDVVDYLAMKEKLRELKSKLSPQDYGKLLLLMKGCTFRGRKAFIREIKVEFDDFGDDDF